MERKMRGITDFLLEHAALDSVSFHMPGHKGSAIYRQLGYGDFLDSLMDCDITEISGADNLFKAEGIIMETAEKYRRLYDVKRSYLLVNGTSGGIIAAILSAVRPGGKLVLARNCHKSVFNALSMGGIEPVYARPQIIDEYGIAGEITAEEVASCLDEAADPDAVILPSPNYYGICSDIERIAAVVHERGKILIVDQAHGAHLRLMEKAAAGEAEDEISKGMPRSAESCGADIVINSTHKTLASFTQSAVLNVASDRVDEMLLEDRLQAIESSSPSYILMASLDINADILERHGQELFARWKDNLRRFYRRAQNIEGLRLMRVPGRMDMTKINLDMSELDLNGRESERLLLEKNIYAELVTGNILMCMTGIGNKWNDYQRLLDALEEIADRSGKASIASELGNAGTAGNDGTCRSSVWTRKRRLCPAGGRKVHLPLARSEGAICACSIIPYPPGIPLVCPGEVIEKDDIAYIESLIACGKSVIGVNENGEILSYLTADCKRYDV